MWWDKTVLKEGARPKLIYISKEEKLIGGYEAAKDKLNLLFGGSASGNVKLKPVLVYHSENPKTLKNIAMGYFPIVWKSNPKASVT